MSGCHDSLPSSEVKIKCPCMKTCCENPNIRNEAEEEDGYCGISVCVNCDDRCNCNM